MLPLAMNNRWHAARTALVCCLLFVAALRCEAQGNLVPNPSFELYDTCPYVTGFLPGGRPLNWWAWDQSPEYFNSCAGGSGGVDTLLDVPLNGFTWQPAFDGDAYIGGATFEAMDFRELVGTELLEPLVVGQTYYVSFYTNLAMNGTYWDVRWASNNIGALFTMEPHVWSGNTGSGPEFAPRNYAHILETSVITDTAGWTLVSGAFVADSAYRFVVLGNFFSDALTDTLSIETGPSWAAYYLFDAVCVSSGSGECPMSVYVPELEFQGILAHPNPVDDRLTVFGHGPQEVWLCDASGRMALFKYCTGDCWLDVGSLAPGCYGLRVRSADSRWRCSKVVIAR